MTNYDYFDKLFFILHSFMTLVPIFKNVVVFHLLTWIVFWQEKGQTYHLSVKRGPF